MHFDTITVEINNTVVENCNLNNNDVVILLIKSDKGFLLLS
jgi:hypothetical protein